jgi:DNA-binding MarR family transcriptional regulator
MTETPMERVAYITNLMEVTHNEIYKYVNDFLIENHIYDLTSKDMFFLYNIYINYTEDANVISTELKKHYHLKNVSYNIEKLVRNNYIEKNLNEKDKKTYFIKFTDKSKILLNKLTNSLNEHYISSVFQDELVIFRKQFEEITQMVEKQTWEKKKRAIQ